MAEQHHRVYSLGTEPTRTGLAGLSVKATGVAIGAFILAVVAMSMQQWKLTLIIAFFATVFVGLVSMPFKGRSLGEGIQLWVQIAKRRMSGTDTYIAGPESELPGGYFQQPGLSASTQLLRGVDATGRDFGIILDVSGRKATVCLKLNLSGDVPRTTSERYEATDRYGGWLASLSLWSDIDSAVTVVATRPATGSLMKREVAHLESEDGSPIAREVAHQAADMLGNNVPEIEAHTAITFKISMKSPSDREFINQIVYRLPTMYRGLSWAGITAVPMTDEEISARALSFACPDTEANLEHLAVTGRDHGLSWNNVGNGFAVDMGDHYFHDGCRSMSFEMINGPAATFEEGVLRPLLAPHPRIERKRVALVYRPYEASRGAKLVEKEWIDARNELTSQRNRARGSSELREEQTNEARRAFARGAQLGRHSLIVTVTTNHDADLAAVEADVMEISAQSNIRLAKMTGWQDAGFDISRGLGQLPFNKETTASALRK